MEDDPPPTQCVDGGEECSRINRLNEDDCQAHIPQNSKQIKFYKLNIFLFV